MSFQNFSQTTVKIQKSKIRVVWWRTRITEPRATRERFLAKPRSFWDLFSFLDLYFRILKVTILSYSISFRSFSRPLFLKNYSLKQLWGSHCECCLRNDLGISRCMSRITELKLIWLRFKNIGFNLIFYLEIIVCKTKLIYFSLCEMFYLS